MKSVLYYSLVYTNYTDHPGVAPDPLGRPSAQSYKSSCTCLFTELEEKEMPTVALAAYECRWSMTRFITSSKNQRQRKLPTFISPECWKKSQAENTSFPAIRKDKRIISTKAYCSAMQFLSTRTQVSSTLNHSSWPARTLRTQRKSPYRTPQPFMLFLSFILKLWEHKDKSTKMSKTSITMTIIVMDKQILFASAHSQYKACPQLGRV